MMLLPWDSFEPYSRNHKNRYVVLETIRRIILEKRDSQISDNFAKGVLLEAKQKDLPTDKLHI
jgi:hypothetical protein